MTAFLRRISLALLLLAAAPAFAQEPQYGYVVGTLEPAKSFLEKLDPTDKGKYLHYHLFLTTDSGTEYTVVLDVNDVSPTTPLLYRFASLDGLTSAQQTADFGPVFGATGDFHLISNSDASYGAVVAPTEAQRQAAGALDYLRHPGVLKALEGEPWQKMYATTTSDPQQWALPLFDSYFKPFVSPIFLVHVWTKVYVFGAPFTTGGAGMHVVHQNQGDTSGGYQATNGTWQDGGVIIERHSSFGIDGPVHVSRTLLMTKFANQNDFTAESNDLSKPAPAGHAMPAAATTNNYSFSVAANHTQTFGPFSATQIEVSTPNAWAVKSGTNSYPQIEVAVKDGAFTGDSDQGDYVSTDYSYNSDPMYRAFARAYTPLWTWYLLGPFPNPTPHAFNIRGSYYVKVRVLDAGAPAGSSAGGTLKVSTY